VCLVQIHLANEVRRPSNATIITSGVKKQKLLTEDDAIDAVVTALPSLEIV
jgi:hypothetical protein